MKWTDEQQSAIDARNCNLLVAAAAGSGKTAVLIERIVNRVVPQNDNFDEKGYTDIDKLLIVTFTKAAAAEMRERLGKALEKRLETCSSAIADRIIRQKALLSKAYITTIDAFCSAVVKQNFISCKLDPAFTIGDTNEMDLLKNDVLDDLLERYYEKKDPAFIRLSKTYSGKITDGSFAEMILKIYDFTQNDASPVDWLKKQYDRYNDCKNKNFWDTVWGEYAGKYTCGLIRDVHKEIDELLAFCMTTGIDSYVNTIEKEAEAISALDDLMNKGDYEKAFASPWSQIFMPKIGTYTGPEKSLANLIKDKRSRIKETVTAVYKSLFGGGADPSMDIISASEDMKCLCQLLIDYTEELLAAKHEKRMYEFGDIEHFALDLLVDDLRGEGGGFSPTNIAFRYQKQFDEIYIDEYQDTSFVQEVILNSVAGRTCGDKNVFMVGDIKQSIYGFRQARPDLFLSKYNSYSEDVSAERLICLYANFRSRRCVVDGANSVFSKIMKSAVCDMDYTKREYLNYAATCYKGTEEYDEKCEFVTIETNDNKSYDEWERASDVEIEARYIASRICEMINSKHQVYDDGMRDIRPGDIAVLMRKSKGNVAVFTEVFAAYGLQSVTAEKGGFFRSPEINSLLAFLKVIDNPYQDIPLMALMRSKIYGFSDDDIAQIRINYKHCSLYDSCICVLGKIDKSGEYVIEPELAVKLSVFINRIKDLRYMSGMFSVYDLVWLLANENDFYNRVAYFDKGAERQANIRSLLDKAAAHDSNGGGGLFKFIRLLQRFEDEDKDLGVASVCCEMNDAVKIMTIHKSKGLEFPVVFLARTTQEFKSKRLDTGNILLHRELGLNPFCYFENGEKSIVSLSFMRNIADLTISKEQKAEEMRLLYVAITRAREKFIAVGIGKKTEDTFPLSDNVGAFSILNSKKYYDWLKLVVPFSEYWEESFVSRQEAYTKPESVSADASDIENDTPNDRQMQDKPVETNISVDEKEVVPVKISVSDIKRLNRIGEEPDEDEAVKDFFNKRKNVILKKLTLNERKSGEKRKFTSAEKGTFVHTCLQCMDFAKCRSIETRSDAERFVDEYLQELVQKDIFDENEANAVDKNILTGFILSRQGRRIINADKVYCEVPFTLQMKWSEIVGDMALENLTDGDTSVSVQGIIDCFIEENGEISVFDYKTDYVNGENFNETDKSYRLQLQCYCKAIERITGKTVKNAEILYLRSLT